MRWLSTEGSIIAPDRLVLSIGEGRPNVGRLFLLGMHLSLMMQLSDLRCPNGTDIICSKLEQMVLGRDAKLI